MSLAASKKPIRAMALARDLLACAWRQQDGAASPKHVDFLQATAARRQTLPREELALIDALRLRIGPVFAAAMARSSPDAKATGQAMTDSGAGPWFRPSSRLEP